MMGVLRRAAARVYELPVTGGRHAALEGLRAYAAFLIFLVHYCDSYARTILGIDLNTLTLGTVPDLRSGLLYYFFASHYGVDVFFFLSGFLICGILRRPGFEYGRFVVRRLARIYPAFLISLLVWAYVRIVVQRWYPLDLAQFAGNLAFLNALPDLGVTAYNVVTWSLFFELVFYLVFPLVLYLGGRERAVTPRGIIVFAAVFMPVALQLDAFFIRFVMFFGGALLATLSPERLTSLARRVPGSLALALYLGSTILFAYLLAYTWFTPVFVVTTFFLVLNLTYGDGALRRLCAWTPLRYFGNISYSFYLVHALGIELIMTGHWSVPLVERGGLAYLAVTSTASLIVSVALSTLLFLIAEKPYFAWRPARAGLRRDAGATALAPR